MYKTYVYEYPRSNKEYDIHEHFFLRTLPVIRFIMDFDFITVRRIFKLEWIIRFYKNVETNPNESGSYRTI